jgi:FkbM family methyltransferase
MKSFFRQLVVSATPELVRQAIVQQYKEAQGLHGGHYLYSYSQQAEDLHIQRYFGTRGQGFYVDIGAYHPFQYSNTQLFYSRGWRGINIEPNPDQFAFFPQYRPQDTNLNLAVGDAGETLTYYCFNEPAINSFSKPHADDWASRDGFYITRTLQIATLPLADILEKHLPGGQAIDFISIDAEGWDLAVLASNDWQRYRPQLVLVEAGISADSPIGHLPVSQYLQKVGYRLWCVSGGTLFFENIYPS